MKINWRLILMLALAAAGVSCEKRPQAADSATDDAKLRPEAALVQQGASPSPTFGDAGVSPTPSP